MSFHDGITIGGKHSYRDFGLEIAEREIGLPEKRSIRKSVPFLNGFYDFTKIYGNTTWGERTIRYTFDIIGATVAEADAERMRVEAWLCNVHDEDIYDDSIPDYHFHGSYESSSISENGEQLQLTFDFVCLPFKLSNYPSVITVYEPRSIIIVNEGQPASPRITSAQAITVVANGVQKSISPVTDYNIGLILETGENELTITKANEIVYPYINSTATNNGITFTDNGDGTITANGTATDVAWCWLRGSSERFLPPVGRHRASGCAANVGANNYRIQYYVYNGEDAESAYYYDFGSGVIIEITEQTQYVSAAIRVVSGYTAENVVFDPKMYGLTEIAFTEEVF